MKYADEYQPPHCELVDQPCDNTCEYFSDCPIENKDIADGEYNKRVIEIIRKRYEH